MHNKVIFPALSSLCDIRIFSGDNRMWDLKSQTDSETTEDPFSTFVGFLNQSRHYSSRNTLLTSSYHFFWTHTPHDTHTHQRRSSQPCSLADCRTKKSRWRKWRLHTWDPRKPISIKSSHLLPLEARKRLLLRISDAELGRNVKKSIKGSKTFKRKWMLSQPKYSE